LESEAGVEDAAGRGRKVKLPDEVATEAAKLVKAGFEVRPVRGSQSLPARRNGFHTIGDAVRRVPRLKEILDNYDITADHLLRRMHAVDPGLHWGRVDVKAALTDAHKLTRLTYARKVLALIAQDPSFLDFVVWVDEVKIWLFSGKASDVHVWCDAHDQGVRLVVPGCGTVGGKPVIVALYAAVNAKLGLVGWQYTYPTTGFPDKWQQRAYGRIAGAAERRDTDYKVRGLGGHCVNITLPYGSISVVQLSSLVTSRQITSCRKAKGSLSPLT
jgi:hypothetical protein